MININKLFSRNPGLLDKPEVKKLIVYIQDLEGEIFEKKIEENYDKEHMLKSMLSDILSSCREYEENKLLQDRYPDLYEKVDSDALVKNLMTYISDMNIKNDLRL
jgi:membrane-bound lytic murein transglycosylase MltF